MWIRPLLMQRQNSFILCDVSIQIIQRNTLRIWTPERHAMLSRAKNRSAIQEITSHVSTSFGMQITQVDWYGPKLLRHCKLKANLMYDCLEIAIWQLCAKIIKILNISKNYDKELTENTNNRLWMIILVKIWLNEMRIRDLQ